MAVSEIHLTVVPRISGALSIFGSGSIILCILTNRRKRNKAKHRLILGMSLCDIIASSACLVFPAPRGYSTAMGRDGACVAQGFLLQMFALQVPIYNASLAIYYLLVVRYKWRDWRLHRKVLPWMHAVPLTMGTGTAIACLPLTVYNPDPLGVFCHISPVPLDCNESYKNGGETNCIRGDNANLYRFLFFSSILLCCIFVVSASMILVFWTVRQQEIAVERYRYNDSNSRKRSKQVARQAFLYLLAFYATWLPSIIRNFVRIAGDDDSGFSFALAFVQLTLVPLQGFFNAMVYFQALKTCKHFWANNSETLMNKLRRPAQISTSSIESQDATCEGSQTGPNINRSDLSEPETKRHSFTTHE